jgi:hypothetical protein
MEYVLDEFLDEGELGFKELFPWVALWHCKDTTIRRLIITL